MQESLMQPGKGLEKPAQEPNGLQQLLSLRDIELRLLSSIDKIILQSDFMLSNVFQLIVDGALKTFEGSLAQLLIAKGSQLEIVCSSQSSDVGRLVDIHNSVSGRAFRTKEAQIVPNSESDKEFMRFLPDTKSELAVPIIEGEIPIGVINVEAKETSAFDCHDKEFLRTLGGQAALAFRLASMFDHMRLVLLSQQWVTKGEDGTNECFRILAEKVFSLVGRCSCYLFCVTSTELELLFPPHLRGKGRFVFPKESVISDAVSTRGKSVSHSCTDPGLMTTEAAPIVSGLAIPIILAEEVLGVVAVFRDPLIGFWDHDVHNLEMFSKDIATLLTSFRNFRTFNEAQSIICSMWTMAAIGDEAGNLMHTFKTPVTAIRAIVQELNRKLPKYIKKHRFLGERLNEISEAAAEGLQFVGEFRELLAEYKGDFVYPQLILLNPYDAIRMAIEPLRKPVNVTLDFCVAEELPMIKTVRAFDRIPHNLVKNAYDSTRKAIELGYRREAKVTIKILPSKDHWSKETNGVEIIIEDTGVGIPKDKLDRLFDFYSSQELGQGSGFGLWWTKKVLDRVGGKIFVDSDHQMGSTFTIYHPIQPPWLK